jgi:hypothetical protein
MFRQHMQTLDPTLDLNCAFGYVKEKKSAKSKITFSESQIKDSDSKQLTRNAIDRFTNGTKEGALFTEITVFNGNTQLEIGLRGDISDEVKNALLAVILDLHRGYASVGGLTSVGRGLFRVISVNGSCFSDSWDIEELKGVVFGGK